MRIGLSDGKLQFHHAVPGFVTQAFTAERHAHAEIGLNVEFERFLSKARECTKDQDCPKPTNSPFIVALDAGKEAELSIKGHFELRRHFGAKDGAASGTGLLAGVTLPEAEAEAFVIEIGSKWFVVFSDNYPAKTNSGIMHYHFSELLEEEIGCLR